MSHLWTTPLNFLALDTESTGAQRPSKGSALDPRNRMCYVGLGNSDFSYVFPMEYDQSFPFGPNLQSIEEHIALSDLLVLFNAKHDLHWLRRYGLWPRPVPVWDCQTAEFIIHGQSEPFPSLDNTSRRYGSDGKLDIIELEYWDRGRDTDEVPVDLLETYLHGDISATVQTFLGQLAHLEDKPLLKKLIWNNSQDEVITADMEWNGLYFDIPGLLTRAAALESDIHSMDTRLQSLFPYPFINWESPKQVSAILYGGSIPYQEQESYIFDYKGGKRPSVEKTRSIRKELQLPRLVEPLPRTESASGAFSTDTKVLRKLKAVGTAKEVIELVLERRGTQTQIDRYFRGIPKKYDEMGWEDNIVHGQLHHSVASTGRLSSSNPNQQNIDERARVCLMTRFKT